MERNNKPHILSMPPEVIVQILQNLSYGEIQIVRPTCQKFNAAGLYIQSKGLRSLKTKTDAMVSHFINAGWLKISHANTGAKYLYHRRMNKGASSLMILAGMIRVADAATFYLIKEGILPPFPGTLLENFNKALSLATRRNPLVGKERLKNLYKSLVMYLKENDISPEVQLNQAMLLKSITELLECLPVRREMTVQTDHGILHFSCLLPLIPIEVAFNGQKTCDALAIVNILLQLGMHAVRKFVHTDQPSFIAKSLDLGSGSVLISEAQLFITTHSVEEKLDVLSLKELPKLDLESFYIILSGTAFSGESLDTIPTSFTYYSPGWPDPIKSC